MLKFIEIVALLAPALSDESEVSQDAVKGSALLQMVTHSAVVRDNFIEDSFDASHGKQTDAGLHDRFQGTEKMVLGLLSESIQSNRSMITQATKDILKNVKDSIDQAKSDDLTANHDADQASLDQKQSALNACVSDLNTKKIAAFATTSSGKLQIMNAGDTTHSTCRADQKSLVADRDTKCDTLKTYIANLNGVDNIAKPNRGGNGQYFSEIETFVGDNKQQWATKETECATAETAVGTKDVECDTAQSTFEQAVCALEAQIWADCSSYAECYYVALEAWNTEKAAVAAKEELRRHEWKVFDRLKCLLDVLINDDSEEDVNTLSQDVETCKNAAYPDDAMNLQTELNWEPPAKQVCDMATVHVHPNGVHDKFFENLHEYANMCPDTRTALPDDGMFSSLDGFMSDVSECSALPAIPNVNYQFDDTRTMGQSREDCEALAVARGMVFMQAYESAGTAMQNAGCYTYTPDVHSGSYCQVWYAGGTGGADVTGTLENPVVSGVELLRATVKPSENAMACLKESSLVAADIADPNLNGR